MLGGTLQRALALHHREQALAVMLWNRAGSRIQVFLISVIPSKLAEMDFTSKNRAGEIHFFQPNYHSH